MRVVIIGGGSAGTSCAFELRKLDKEMEIIIIEKSSYYDYSPCALPYLINDEIPSVEKVFIYQKEDYEKNNIKILLNSEVYDVNASKVFYKNNDQEKEIEYDKLIIATGGVSFIPKIKGLSEHDYYQLKTIDDVKKIKANINEDSKSVIIGAGMIGMELACALKEKGEEVTLIEKEQNILTNMLDKDIAQELLDFFKELNVEVVAHIKEIKDNRVILENKEVIFDKLFVCTGFRVNAEIAQKLSLKVNKGIVVDEFFQTSRENIYAIGDCIEQKEFNSDAKIVSQLGSLAVLQARMLAANICGFTQAGEAVVNNTVSKMGDIYVGSVGLTENRAQAMGLEVLSVKYRDNLRAKYYSEKEKIIIKLIFDREGVILGGQIIAHGEIVGRLDLLSLAIKQKMTVNELSKLETCYNPATVSVFEPLSVAAIIAEKKVTFLKNN